MTIKKITTLLMLSVLPLGVLTAQEEKDYLPKAGDLAIGIDMRPVYRFIGNIANGYGTDGTPNSLNQFGGEDALGIIGDVSIMGKYMLDNTTAIRFNVGMDKDNVHNATYQIDDKALFLNPLSEAKVTDVEHHNSAYYSLAAGIEFRKGKDRIQGYYGADLVLAKGKEHYKFEYGNAVTELNQSPSRTNYNANLGLGVVNPGYWSNFYVTESFAKVVQFGVAGKLGVEYFIVPKVSLGGEVSLLISKQISKVQYNKTEGYNPSTAQVETHTELEAPKNREFHMGTENMGGKLFMMFYF